MSPTGDCEQVTHSGGLPRCPDGYHRSPSGDCEQVSSGETDNTNSRPVEDNQEEITSNESLSPSDGILLTQSGECRGEAIALEAKLPRLLMVILLMSIMCAYVFLW